MHTKQQLSESELAKNTTPHTNGMGVPSSPTPKLFYQALHERDQRKSQDINERRSLFAASSEKVLSFAADLREKAAIDTDLYSALQEDLLKIYDALGG